MEKHRKEARITGRLILTRAAAVCLWAVICAVAILSCDIIPADEPPHSNLSDPDNPDYTGPEFPEAELSGTPEASTYAASLRVTVGGDNVAAYRYRLDEDSYSEETDIDTPITASGLEPGVHTLSVIGKNADELWQWESRATSFTWTILEAEYTTPPDAINILSDSTYVYDPASPLTLTWPTLGSGVWILVMRGTSSISDVLPVDRTAYTAGETVSGCLVICAARVSEISDLSLDSDGTYYYRAFAYDKYYNYASGGAEQSVTVYRDAVYVHFDGDDGNPGTSGAPKRTIQAGIDTAAAVGGLYEVRVAGSASPSTENYGTADPGTPLAELSSGISLYGGYSPTDWSESARDPSVTESRLYTSGSLAGDGCIVHTQFLTSSVTIDGFTIEGADLSEAGFTSGIYVEDSADGVSVTISDCDIVGGSNLGTVGTTAGIRAYDSQVTISGNRRIWGGRSSSGTAAGIHSTGSNSVITVTGNDTGTDCIGTAECTGGSCYGIYIESGSGHLVENSAIRIVRTGGTGSGPQAIHLQNADAVVRNCRIECLVGDDAGTALYAAGTVADTVTVYNNHIVCRVEYGGDGGSTAGVAMDTLSFELYNNNIISGPCGESTSTAMGINILAFGGTTAVVNNNIICPGTYGASRTAIAEQADDGIGYFGANNIFGSGSSFHYYHDFITGDMDTIAEVNSLTPPNKNNISESLEFDSDGHVTTDPTTRSFDTEGIDGANAGEPWVFTTDKGGSARTGGNGWSIGAYEYD